MMTSRNQLLLGGLIAALVLAATVGAKLAAAAGIVGSDASLRASQIMTGLLLAFFANDAPKRRSAVAVCAPAKRQASRRLAGWLLTLAGLGYALSWLLAPIGVALVIAPALVMGALAVVLEQCVRARLRSGASIDI